MTPNQKKKINNNLRKTSPLREAWWFRQILMFVYELSLFRIGAIVISIVILLILGDLFTKDGLILVSCLLVFLILLYLKIKFDKEDKS